MGVGGDIIKRAWGQVFAILTVFFSRMSLWEKVFAISTVFFSLLLLLMFVVVGTIQGIPDWVVGPGVVVGFLGALFSGVAWSSTVSKRRDEVERRKAAEEKVRAGEERHRKEAWRHREEGKRKRVPREGREKVFRRDGGRCVQCGDNFDLQYDHIIPWSRGGADSVQNLQLLCSRCNQSKGNRHVH